MVETLPGPSVVSLKVFLRGLVLLGIGGFISGVSIVIDAMAGSGLNAAIIGLFLIVVGIALVADRIQA